MNEHFDFLSNNGIRAISVVKLGMNTIKKYVDFIF